MTVEFRKLADRIITDAGQVVFRSNPRLEYHALLGMPLRGVPAVEDAEVIHYNRRNPEDAVAVWRDDGVIVGPDRSTFEWSIPDEYIGLDLADFLTARYQERIKDDPNGVYAERLVRELDMMRDREMYPFLRCLIYVIDVFKQRGIVWGVGRGSSCASLVMFLIGVNKVDPVLYDIPIEEFLK
jgi:hypothetical protein